MVRGDVGASLTTFAKDNASFEYKYWGRNIPAEALDPRAQRHCLYVLTSFVVSYCRSARP
eukprot:scaffold172373_cov31-Tisochrysis_lutea.AAC.3